MWNNQGGYDNYDQGGGYMNSQANTQGGSSGDKKTYKSKSLVPCSIGRLLTSTQEDDTFVSNGIELNQVTVMGLVVKAEEANNYHLYSITDMSGPAIEIRDFVDTEEENQDTNTLFPVNSYVYVFGNLRSFGNKRSISAFKLRAVTDLNELTSHLLECMYAQVYKSKAIKQPQNNMDNPVSHGNMTAGDQDMGLSKNQMQVLNCIKASIEEHGVTINEVTTKLSGLPKKQIMDAIEFLSNEGHVYSTIDDDHFKATDV